MDAAKQPESIWAGAEMASVDLPPKVMESVAQSRELLITTYDGDGNPGTVPVWFDYHQGRFYVSTPPDTLKYRKIRQDPRVRLTFGDADGPGIDGTAKIVAEAATIDEVAPIHHERYGGELWRDAEDLARMWRDSTERVLIEVTPDPSA